MHTSIFTNPACVFTYILQGILIGLDYWTELFFISGQILLFSIAKWPLLSQLLKLARELIANMIHYVMIPLVWIYITVNTTVRQLCYEYHYATEPITF